jgi:hypothetical protein
MLIGLLVFLHTVWVSTVGGVFRNNYHFIKFLYISVSVLKGSDDGVIHFKESCFTTLFIVQCFSLKTTFRKLALLPSSGKKWGGGGNLLRGVP